MSDAPDRSLIPPAAGRHGTIAAKLAQADNRPAGFDYLRLVLASGVICTHTINTSYGQAAAEAFWDTPARLLVGPILPMFFALSGFLVAGSLARCVSLISFLGLRAMRIVPALAVEVVLSALLLGPLLTALPLADYFASNLLHRYFLNVVGMIHYVLPGVFLDNPVPGRVNGQLWTVPFELECYALIALLAMLGIAWHRVVLLMTTIALQLLLLARWWLGNGGDWTTVPGPVLVFCFLCGITLYAWRDRLRWDWGVCAGSAALGGVLLLTPGGDWIVAAPITYVTVFMGTLDPPRQRLMLSGDYSYGIFLYGYPLQQLVASFGPDFRHWWINLIIAFPLALIVAVLSWWTVERPILAHKPRLLALEAWLIERVPRSVMRPILREPDRVRRLLRLPSRSI